VAKGLSTIFAEDFDSMMPEKREQFIRIAFACDELFQIRSVVQKRGHRDICVRRPVISTERPDSQTVRRAIILGETAQGQIESEPDCLSETHRFA
jgi:hypothetical protein